MHVVVCGIVVLLDVVTSGCRGGAGAADGAGTVRSIRRVDLRNRFFYDFSVFGHTWRTRNSRREAALNIVNKFVPRIKRML